MGEIEEQADIKIKSIDEEFTRTNKYINDMGFDNRTLARRANDMKLLRVAYPTLSDMMLEMAWNFCEITPQEEHDKIINGKLWENQKPRERILGGTSQSMAIYTKEEYERDNLNDLPHILGHKK